MNSNNAVEQGAAVILCSAERAEALGVPRDRWVFPHSGTDAHDHYFVSDRDDLRSSPAIRLAGRDALDLAGIGVDDLAHVDLYSCFPSAVEIAAAELGLDLDRQLTVTGGLSFAGGPWNNYVTHSIAAMAGVLRDDPGQPRARHGQRRLHHQARLRRVQHRAAGHAVPARRAAGRGRRAALAARICEEPDGPIEIESWTVIHDRDGDPETGLVVGLLADGQRAWGTTAGRRPAAGDASTEELAGRKADAPPRRRLRTALADGSEQTAVWPGARRSRRRERALAQDAPAGRWWRRSTVDARPSSGPSSTTTPTPGPARAAPPRRSPRWARRGGWRSSPRSGRPARPTARTSGWSGTRTPTVVAGSPRWRSTPARRGQHERERARPPPLPDGSHARPRPPAERRGPRPGARPRTAPRSAWRGRGPSASKSCVHRRRRRRAARRARRRCRWAARTTSPGEQRLDHLRRRRRRDPRWRRRWTARSSSAVNQQRATRARSRPARSGWTSTSAKPAARASVGDRVALVVADLDTRVPAGPQPARRLGDDRAGRGRARRPRRRARRAGSRSRTCRGDERAVGDVGRVGDDDVERAPQLVGQRGEPVALDQAHHRAPGGRAPARLARATASASADTSVAHTSTSGQRSAASDSAMAPEPVPRSTDPAARRAPRRWRSPATTSVSAAGSAPAGRRAGRACGSPSCPSTYCSGSPAARRATIASKPAACRSSATSSSAAVCSAAVSPLACSTIQRTSCAASTTPGLVEALAPTSRSCAPRRAASARLR